MSIKNVTTTLQSLLGAINELPEANGEQATPVISVDSSNGLITATAGTKTSTHQLAFQPAKTITPSTTNQTAVAGGYYTGGNITVKGDANLVAGNIKNGVSIFGVTGTLVEGDGTSSGEQVEWSANEDAMVTRTLSSYFNDRVTTVGDHAFYYNTNLITVNFPVCTSIGSNAFKYCRNLTTVNFPVCTSIDGSAFDCCKLTTVSFPVCTTVGDHAFYYNTNLTTVNFPVCTSIGKDAFRMCYQLTTVSFPVCTIIGSTAFADCKNLTTISFPACTSICYTAFSGCINLTTVNFPVCTSIGGSAFAGCSNLTTINFPVCTSIGYSAFAGCSKLTTVNFPVCTIIGYSAFAGCSKLTTITLGTSTVCTLSNSNVFQSTAITSTKGSIFVPASLVSSYKTATNWTYFADRIFAIES